MRTLLFTLFLLLSGLTNSLAAITTVPAQVTFTAAVGSTPAPQDVTINVSTGAAWTASDNSPWFHASPPNGAAGATIHITFPYSLAGYGPGTYNQTIHFTATGNTAIDLPVKMILVAGTPAPTATPGLPTPTRTPGVPTATPTRSPTPGPASPIPPLSTVFIQWTNPSDTQVTGIRIYDDQGQVGPPRFLRQISRKATTQSAALQSLLPGTNFFPGSQHIFYVSAVRSDGVESGFSNPAPYTVPVPPAGRSR